MLVSESMSDVSRIVLVALKAGDLDVDMDDEDEEHLAGWRGWRQVQLGIHLRSLEQVCHLSANRPIRTQACQHQPMRGQGRAC